MTENTIEDVKFNDDEAAAPVDPPAPEVNAILVRVEREVDGSVSTRVEAVGDVRVTEIPTLLKLAVKAFDKQVGLDA